MAWIYLIVAVITEVVATIALKASDGFNNSTASTICIVGYCIAFYCLAEVVKTIPVGIAYAIWAGAGIVLVTIFSTLWLKQAPDIAAIIGIILIIIGVVTINLFSKTVSH